MKRIIAFLLGASLLILAAGTEAPTAYAAVPSGSVARTAILHATAGVTPGDTENCASHGEYDQLQYGMTVLEVANLLDIYGVYLGDTDTHFRRGYRTCWAPGTEQIVVAFSYDTGWSNAWWIRDI